MATMSRTVLSGSTNGKGIKVGATAIGSGTTIHTNSAGLDEVDLWVANNDASVTYTLTIGWGGTTSIDDTIIVVVPPRFYGQVVAKLPISGTLVVKAACDTTNKLSIFGGVTHIV